MHSAEGLRTPKRPVIILELILEMLQSLAGPPDARRSRGFDPRLPVPPLMLCISRSRLRKFLAGGLLPEEEKEIAVHTEQCAPCRERLELLATPSPDLELLHTAWERAAATAPATLDVGELPAGWAPDESIAGEVPPVATNLLKLGSIGRFLLRRQLGFGGCGVVYLAFDTVLRREVALKVPHAATLSDERLRAKFLREGEVVALLHHENILPVFEAGEEGGLCYIASAYCPGPNLAEWLGDRGEPVPPRMAAEIVLCLAHAAEHAHQAGLLHRDIKPANVLLDPSSRTGSLDFTPTLTDFGLASFLEEEGHRSLSGMISGTPRYMAPEQAAGRRASIGRATDVYALGAVLYELIAGRPPLLGENDVETLQRIAQADPLPLRRQAPGAPADLEAICHCCLQKRPEKRYATAAALADDLQRFLNGEATQARPDGLVSAAGRWVRRYPAQARLAAFATLLLLLIVGGLWAHTLRLERLNDRLETAVMRERLAHRQALRSERNNAALRYVADFRMAAEAAREGDHRYVGRFLDRHAHPPFGEDRGFEWWYLWSLSQATMRPLEGHRAAVYELRFSADGRRLATAGAEGVIRLFDGGSGELRNQWPSGQKEVNGLAFSPDGQRLASAGDDGTLCLWDAQDGRRLLRVPAFDTLAYEVAFADGDRQLVACGQDRRIGFWDAGTGTHLRWLDAHEKEIESLAMSLTGSLLATAGRDNTARLWDPVTGRRRLELTGHSKAVMCLAFSPDEQLLATGSKDGSVRVWQTRNGESVADYKHLDGVESVAFTPDGQRVLAGDRGGVIHAWSLPATKEAARAAGRRIPWNAHQGRVFCLATSPDGTQLISSGEDGCVRCWSSDRPESRRLLLDSRRRNVNAMVHDASGKCLWTAGEQGLFRQTLEGARARGEPGSAKPVAIVAERLRDTCLAIAPRKRLLALGDQSGTVRILDAATHTELARWQLPPGADVEQLLFVHQESQLAAISFEVDEWIFLYDLQGRLQRRLPTAPYCGVMAASPDGQWLAHDVLNEIQVWNLAEDEPAFRLPGHGNSITDLAFSPDGRWLASASRDRSVRVWRARDGRPAAILTGHRADVTSVAFAGDGRSLASGDAAGSLRIWHVGVWQELAELDRAEGRIERILFSPDNELLAYLADGEGVALLSAGRD